MLPKAQRLSRTEFAALLKAGTRLQGRYMTLISLSASHDSAATKGVLDTYKCGVVVSKKVSPSAVTRHALRRAVYEAVRPQVKDVRGLFFALLLKPTALHTSKTALTAEVQALICDVSQHIHKRA